MINAKQYSQLKTDSSKKIWFDKINNEEGADNLDRPLIVQFAANDPKLLLESAKDLQGKCDAVDLNLGCPQHIARRGRYGSWLQDEWDLIHSLINTLHENLQDIPVTAKFRVFDDVNRTVEYAKLLESAGAQILTVHGRTREMKGHNTGLADWEKIKAVKDAVNVPVFANGNILYQEDIEKCLRATGCDGVMSAEGNLYNPAIFSEKASHPYVVKLAKEYLDIVDSLKTETSVSAQKAHLFKIFKPCLSKWTDLRDRLGKGQPKDWRGIVEEFETRIKSDAEFKNEDELSDVKDLDEQGYRTVPYFYAQPYLRPTNVDNIEVEQNIDVKQQIENDIVPQREHLAVKETPATDSQGQPVTKLKKQKACLTCRRAKLKCEIPVPGEPCKRCISTGVEYIKQMNFEPVGLDPIFDNPESTSDHIAANSTKENMNSLTVGSLDPRPNVIKKGVISQSAAEELVDFFHSNLSSQLFGFRLQIGHFPYLPEGKSTLTPLITGVICLASSERILSDNLRSLVGNLLVDLDDFSFKPAITQYYSSQNQESIDDDELDLELGVGPEEIVAMCIASIFCDMSTRPNPKKSTIDGCNSSSHMIAQVAFKWARGFLKTSMLSVPPQMTIGEACGYLPPRRQLGLENWLRLWLFTYVVESQASFYSSRPSKMYDPTSFCTLLLEASAPGHPNDNSRDKQLVAHARICTLLRQARQTLDSRDWLNSNLSDTRSCLDGWNEELESWRRVNLPESALIAADQWPATSLTLFYLFARLYINQIAIGDSIMQSQEENFGTSSERWRYATAAVKAAAQMLDAVAEEPLCSTWSLLPLIYIKMISLAAGVLLKSVHVLDKIAPVVTIEQIRVSVIKVAEILKNGAPGQSETHLARATSASLINQVAKLQPTARSLQT
ncbi:hypothetical protein E3Q13_02663 [Wallemia mellicola]|nr:hypothetical protein E3Q13_02663 [Wallemia mellicola]